MSVAGSAVISPCGHYRYLLQRQLAERLGVIAAWYMVNPSTADADDDDHTIRKVVGLTTRHTDANTTIVCNKFAFRATDVNALKGCSDPVGPENDAWIEATMKAAHIHIVAWGPLGKLPPRLRRRWRTIVGMAERHGRQLMCFGTANDGHPRHPLTLAWDTPLQPWKPPL